MLYDYNILLLDILPKKTKSFNKQKQSRCVMVGITQKNLWRFISIVVSYCPLDNCPRHIYQ